jgi:hypothetical protein
MKIFFWKTLKQMQKTEHLIFMYTPGQTQSLKEITDAERLFLSKPFSSESLLKCLFQLRK